MMLHAQPNWIVPTPPAGDSSNRVANTQFVGTAIANFSAFVATSIASSVITSYVASVTASTNLNQTNTTGNVTIFSNISNASAVLATTVSLNNTANYFDGPTISLGTGTWFVFGKVLVSAGTVPTETYGKLWDGTTVYDSGSTENVNATRPLTLALAGIAVLAAATTVKISCRNPNSADGTIYFNQSGNSQDSSLRAFRLA